MSYPYRKSRNHSTYHKVPLDLKNPRVQELGERYNIADKVVAYIRAALGGKRYTKQTLIAHIEESINVRIQAIEEHKNDYRFTKERKEKLIEYTQNNIDFRRSVIATLHRLTQYELNDILQ